MKKKAICEVSPRHALLEVMKLACSPEPAARADFRADVDWLWNEWSGVTPLLWFSGVEGTMLLDLGTNALPMRSVKSIQIGFEAACRMQADLFCVTEPDRSGNFSLLEVEPDDARAALREYWGLDES